jgi:hypothetical protein
MKTIAIKEKTFQILQELKKGKAKPFTRKEREKIWRERI